MYRQIIKPLPILKGQQFMRLLSSTAKKSATIAATPLPTLSNSTAKQFASSKYLTSLNNSELLGYAVIGMATLTPWTLKAVIALFPYTPLFLIKALIYKNYCGGENFKEVLKTGERLSERGVKGMMISYTPEACDGKKMSVSVEDIVKATATSVSQVLSPHVEKMIEAAKTKAGSSLDSVKKAINEIPPSYVALKPTGLIDSAADLLLNFEKESYKPQYNALLKNCEAICDIAQAENVRLHQKYPEREAPFVVVIVDAEKYDLQQGVYKLQRDLMAKYNRLESTVVGTVQMYLKESSNVLENENRLAEQGGYKLGWKLVRGAYIHSEPDRGVIHETKADTDVNYDNGITNTIANMSSPNPTVGHLVVASHNGSTQLKATKLLQTVDTVNSDKVRANVVMGQLLGMADNVTYELVEKYKVKNIIKYVPWGPPLETKDYLLRRLEENGDAVRADSGWPLLKGIINTTIKKVMGSA